MGESSDVAPDFPSGVFCGQKGRIMKDTGDYQFDAASPLMTAASKYGLDVEKIIGGDPAEIAKAQGLGIPVPGAAPGPAASTPPTVQSALASAAPGASVGTNTPEPTGSSAKQPQAGMPAQTASQQPSAADAAQLTQAAQAAAPHLANAVQAAAPILGPEKTNSLASAFRSGVQGQAPASVPSTISPTGSAQDDPNQRTLQQASQLGMDYAKGLAGAPTLQSQEQAIQAKRTLPPQEYDPAHPEYKPTVGRRIMRGIVGGLEGFGEGLATGSAGGAIGDAIVGAVNPGKVGATPYGAPTRQFSIAAQRQAAQSAALDKQQATLESSYKEDTGRAKDVIQSINDIGKNAAAGQNAQARMDTAAAREETARVAGQLADIKQQVADYQSQGKIPTTFEATSAAWALEKDPAKKAALKAALDYDRETEIRKFQYKAAADGEPRTAFRQSMIDAATEQIKGLQDKYTYNPRRNQYENPNNPNDVLNPSEYTDKKNEISSKLDQQLGQKKMKPLGVRFDPADAGAGKPTGRAARQATQTAPAGNQAKKPAPPTPTVPAPPGAADMALSPADGQYHYRDSGKRDLGVVK